MDDLKKQLLNMRCLLAGRAATNIVRAAAMAVVIEGRTDVQAAYSFVFGALKGILEIREIQEGLDESPEFEAARLTIHDLHAGQRDPSKYN